MRRAAQVDTHQAAIVRSLRAIGCSVQSLARIGDGCPDLLVARAGRMWLLEVKAPLGAEGGRSTDGQKLSALQQDWHQRWRAPVHVVRTVQEAFAVVEASDRAMAYNSERGEATIVVAEEGVPVHSFSSTPPEYKARARAAAPAVAAALKPLADRIRAQARSATYRRSR